ncbi:hypothetical protein AVEN_264765-1 [Araneus ventricosus]|uniref:Uncharacterized protein n=1 Tax=Araneus ventricosus TaxID=182803 RepID=A0A4Y2EFQ7_ARAVE|nr:hypothetical protein AVEN_264765-1 [Araneus ventricosus]
MRALSKHLNTSARVDVWLARFHRAICPYAWQDFPCRIESRIDNLSVLNGGQQRGRRLNRHSLQISATHQREDVWLARFNEHLCPYAWQIFP